MNRGLWLIFFLSACLCETFDIRGEDTFTLGLILSEGRKTSLEMNLAGEGSDNTTLHIKDPSSGIIRTFKNEKSMTISFLPKTAGEHNIVLLNPTKKDIMFTVVLPEADEGPFASQVEANLGKDLEDVLRRIISAHKALLIRQTEHLEKAKSTKSWIKKLTLFEVCLCLLALYYVHTEAVKTFYSTRKM
ncbi:hypothetical protein NEMIN01_1897 [Nematocida minor]|uniref:uncharacterized protein n=1 Tax=Nematocida minor TaxID=1912983 RepID=UPI0022200A94|nr:uncharacterized protein NEMIN01_1897 [Nematocida minor]KAI5192245.1 hypothetical protein NEMIN01_1897 [Nematocida minor]